MSLARWFTLAFAVALVGVVVWTWRDVAVKPKSPVSKVTIGRHDGVYFSDGAKASDALALGRALQECGYFTDKGAVVMLSRGEDGSIVSFVLGAGAWDDPKAIAALEQIGRVIAPSIGGYPVVLHLVDATWMGHKSLLVGKLMVGAHDAIYYFGGATEGNAVELGGALRKMGYLADTGSTVAIWKDGETALGFVVTEGVWARQDAVNGFERLAREVAPSVGGLPVRMRLLSGAMEIKDEVEVR